MICPKCKDSTLQPTKLEASLPAMGCPKCDGALLSLLYYRDWIERTQPEALENPVDASTTAENDTKTALSCAKCSRLMTKYSVSGTLGNRIDLCSSCDDAWLDGGEWQLLKSLELANQLPSVFTDTWQRTVRNEKVEIGRIDRLKNIVGEDDANKAVELKKWLTDKEHKATILHFLGTD